MLWTQRLSSALAIMLFLVAVSAATPAHAQGVAFTFVQISDSQPQSSQDYAHFEQVLDAICAAGQPGALLPRPVDFVLFAGDCVWGNAESEWVTWLQMMDGNLTAAGIPYIVIPGNHDQDNGGIAHYEHYVGDSGVWSQGSETLTGNNGLTHSTGWAGLRIIGFNNSNTEWNFISPADLVEIADRVAAAASAGENVLLLCHHPHNGQGVVPLAATLTVPDIVGYLRGHAGNPHATHGLSGINNPNVWDCDSNSIYDDAGLIYYEVFPTEIQAHVIKLTNNPSVLPPASVIALVHPMVPASAVPLNANFAAQPSSGPAPLAVSFTDLSTGAPTSWDWTFGDGGTATSPSPLHVYDDPGSYSVTLTVTNATSEDTLTIGGFITIDETTLTTLAPVADAKVNSEHPTTNYGDDLDLRCRLGSGGTDATYHSYLKFDVPALGNAFVASALLRLYVTDGSTDAGSLFTVGNGWTEGGITYASAPGITSITLGSAGLAGNNTWIQFDVSSVVTGTGPVSFALTSSSSNSVFYSSREGSAPPQLVLAIAPLTCGNGTADPGEDCATCPGDVPCGPGTYCLAGVCAPLCGNGTADPGEDCATCPGDAPCGPGTVCLGGVCASLCGNGIPDLGEDCLSCPGDAPCGPGMECLDGECAPLCGNGTADPGEDCANCLNDVHCGPGTFCQGALCAPSCPWDIDGDHSVAVNDLLELLTAWGPAPGHPADIDLDGTLGVADFLDMLAHWGPCP